MSVMKTNRLCFLTLYISLHFIKFYVNEISSCSGTGWGQGQTVGKDTKEPQENPKGNLEVMDMFISLIMVYTYQDIANCK